MPSVLLALAITLQCQVSARSILSAMCPVCTPFSPHPIFFIFVANKALHSNRSLDLPCVTLGWPLRDPWVAQSQTQSPAERHRQRVATPKAQNATKIPLRPFASTSIWTAEPALNLPNGRPACDLTKQRSFPAEAPGPCASSLYYRRLLALGNQPKSAPKDSQPPG